MKKTLMSVVMASVLVSGSVMAEPAKNDKSRAEIEFTGTVTNSMCQVDDNSLDQKINLGDVSVAQLMNNINAAKKNFNVKLVNCDNKVNEITYTLLDNNGNGESNYLINSAPGGNAATNVGVFVMTPDNTPVDLNAPQELEPGHWEQDEYNIGLVAYIGKTDTRATPTAGLVSAKTTMLIKAIDTTVR